MTAAAWPKGRKGRKETLIVRDVLFGMVVSAKLG